MSNRRKNNALRLAKAKKRRELKLRAMQRSHVELLEPRWLLASDLAHDHAHSHDHHDHDHVDTFARGLTSLAEQLVFVDFDGAQDVDYNGPSLRRRVRRSVVHRTR